LGSKPYSEAEEKQIVIDTRRNKKRNRSSLLQMEDTDFNFAAQKPLPGRQRLPESVAFSSANQI